MAATAMLIVEDMPADYTAQLQREIEEIDGVSQVLSMAGSVGSQLPQAMLPAEFQKHVLREEWRHQLHHDDDFL